VKDHAAFVFHFDVVDVISELPDPPVLWHLDDPEQEVVELILLQKPVMSALEPINYEILKAELVPRTSVDNPTKEVMHFRDWDSFGQKGTPSHFFSRLGSWMVDYLATSTFGIFFFVLGVVVLFVAVCLVCLFASAGAGVWGDEYEQAQHGKSKNRRRTQRQDNGDVETGQGRLRFKTPEELGLLGRGRVVGVGKSD
jgi:hypothetical protein